MHIPRKHAVVAFGLAGALLFGATSCSSSNGDSSGGSGDAAKAATWKVCSDVPFEPFEYPGKGPRGLTYTGFDIDLLDHLAKTQNATLDIRDTDFDTIVGAVNTGTCDVVASAVPITDERKKDALFSDPYFDADQSLLIPVDSPVKTLDDLTGKTIGVQGGTPGESYAKGHTPEGATVRSFPDPAALFAAIDAGQIDAILQDLAVNSERAAKDDAVKVIDTIPTGKLYGFMVAKDNTSLKKTLNAALAQAKNDGTYDKLYARYFPNTGT